jgi:hypothetical protein
MDYYIYHEKQLKKITEYPENGFYLFETEDGKFVKAKTKNKYGKKGNYK